MSPPFFCCDFDGHGERGSSVRLSSDLNKHARRAEIFESEEVENLAQLVRGEVGNLLHLDLLRLAEVKEVAERAKMDVRRVVPLVRELLRLRHTPEEE